MDLQTIRDYLRAARLALGPEHPLSSRISLVERHLTHGDPLWRNDAVSAQQDLLAISTALEQQPLAAPLHVAIRALEISNPAQAVMPAGVNEAIKLIAGAIELL